MRWLIDCALYIDVVFVIYWVQIAIADIEVKFKNN